MRFAASLLKSASERQAASHMALCSEGAQRCSATRGPSGVQVATPAQSAQSLCPSQGRVQTPQMHDIPSAHDASHVCRKWVSLPSCDDSFVLHEKINHMPSKSGARERLLRSI